MADHRRGELPVGVEPLPGGGYRVGDAPGWDVVTVLISVVFGLVGLGMLGLAGVLYAADATEPVLFVLGAVFLVAGPLLAAKLGRQQRRTSVWTIDAEGLETVVGGRVTWSQVAELELHERRTRLAGRGLRPGPWVRLVTVTARDGQGEDLLRLPDENDDHRLRTVVLRAGEDGLLPGHVRLTRRQT